MRTLARIWFPLSMAMLLLMALPGVILLALNLANLGGPANAWLQSRWGLTYHPALPTWAELFFLGLPLLIALLYFLKLKRKPLQVPSTFLWRKSIEDLHVNSLFQWLRQNILLLLQILAVVILLYTIMSFQLHARSGAGRHYLLMIDNSASMSATDVSPNRLEQAKQQALDEIDSYTDDDFGMILVFGSSAEILQSYTNDRGVLRAAVQSIEPTHRPTRLADALTLAESLANPQQSPNDQTARPPGEEKGKERTVDPPEGIPTLVHLFSDGRFADVSDFSLGNLNFQFHSIGDAGPAGRDNVGLVTLNAVRDVKSPGAYQVFATVQNCRPTAAEVRVRLLVIVDGAIRDIYDQPSQGSLTVPAAADSKESTGAAESAKDEIPGEASVSFQIRDVDERSRCVFHAFLVDHHDSFADDDQAWVTVGVVRKAHIAIVGPPNKPLRDFFDQPATEKLASVMYLNPSDLEDEKSYLRPAREGAFDLVIFDRCRPAQEAQMPLANTLFIDRLPPPWTKEDMPRKEYPRILGGAFKHPLMQYITAVQDIHIGEYFRVDLKDPRFPAQTPRLLEGDHDTTLIFTLPRQSFTDVVMAFPIITDQDEWNTDWVKQLSFPLFLGNVVKTLGNVGDAAGEAITQPGQVKSLWPQNPTRTLTITDPSGKKHSLERGARPDFLFGKTDQLGVYQVLLEGGEERSFAVNLLDAQESQISPRREFRLGATAVSAAPIEPPPRPLWHWIALAAFLVILLEWYVYNRRIFV